MAAKRGRPPYTHEQCIEAGVLAWAETGKQPNQREWIRSKRRPTRPVIYRLFVTWGEFLAAVNERTVAPRGIAERKGKGGRPPTYTREDALAAGIAVWAERGKAPTYDEWAKSHRKPTKTVIVRLFGSWANFVGELSASWEPPESISGELDALTGIMQAAEKLDKDLGAFTKAVDKRLDDYFAEIDKVVGGRLNDQGNLITEIQTRLSETTVAPDDWREIHSQLFYILERLGKVEDVVFEKVTTATFQPNGAAEEETPKPTLIDRLLGR